jgi:AcrR family transcriptional regulator
MSVSKAAKGVRGQRKTKNRAVVVERGAARGPQRERILDAAALCFIQSGFHAASIANIAQTAEISPSLIYRYFSSKASIVKAIIERQLNSDHFKMLGSIKSADELCRSIIDTFESWRRRDNPKMDAVLMLEVTVTSTRDTDLARTVQAEDQIICRSLTELIQRLGSMSSASSARSAAVVLQCLVEGLALGALRDPKLDSARIKSVLEAIIAALMGI